MNNEYTITTLYRQPQPPSKYDGETDEDFEERLAEYEEDKNKRFWRVVISTGINSTETRERLAIESELFPPGDHDKYALIKLLTTAGIIIAKKLEAAA